MGRFGGGDHLNEIRIGRVSSVNYVEGSIDVVFPDEEDTVYQDCALLSEQYRMPKANEMVTVIFQTNSQGADQGYVIGIPFSAENLPEEYGKEVYFKRFSPKAYEYYDPDTETLHLYAPHVVVHNLKEE